MKKIIGICLLACSLVACNNNYVVQGTKMKVVPVVVNAQDWKYTQMGDNDQFNNNYFYAGVNMPEITEEVFDAGEVKAYVVYDRMSVNKARKHLLPYVLHVEELLMDNEWVFYTQTIDFTYGIGWAEFNFRMSDFAYEEDVTINPPSMEFDIVITYPGKSK